jgi:hypothetical protein
MARPKNPEFSTPEAQASAWDNMADVLANHPQALTHHRTTPPYMTGQQLRAVLEAEWQCHTRSTREGVVRRSYVIIGRTFLQLEGLEGELLDMYRASQILNDPNAANHPREAMSTELLGIPRPGLFWGRQLPKAELAQAFAQAMPSRLDRMAVFLGKEKVIEDEAVCAGQWAPVPVVGNPHNREERELGGYDISGRFGNMDAIAATLGEWDVAPGAPAQWHGDANHKCVAAPQML